MERTLLDKIRSTIGHLISKLLHKGRHHDGEGKTRSFSDVSFPELVKTSKGIPDYEVLNDLYKFTLTYFGIHSFGQLEQFEQTSLVRYFPIFIRVMNPPMIASYRLDYIRQGKGDWAEICFLMGEEMDIVYDFDRQMWYFRDHTKISMKEYEVQDGHLRDMIKLLIDPEKNEILKKRLEEFKDKFPSEYPRLISYFEGVKKKLESKRRFFLF